MDKAKKENAAALIKKTKAVATVTKEKTEEDGIPAV